MIRSPMWTVALVALAPVALQGQAQATAASGFRYETAHAHPHATAAATAVRIPAGSAQDQEGFEGTAWLLARVLEDQATRALGSTGALLRATVERGATVYTLLATPALQDAAWARVDSVIFDAPIDPELLAGHRRELLANLVFEAGSPVAESEREAAGILADPGSPFTRPPHGTSESVGAISPTSLELYRRSFYRRAAAARAFVGPGSVEETGVEADSTPSGAAAPSPAARMAWTTGDRSVLVRDVTSTWMAVAYPAPADLPRTHLELVAFLLEEELDPTPPDPDRYAVSVRIADTPAGPVLLVDATVFPEAADRWEERITGAVERMADTPLGEDFFRWRRRRFRTDRLLRESAPEAEAARLSADLLREGSPRNLSVEIWALDAESLRDAAAALGPPRVFRFGPDLRQDGPAGG